MPILTDESMGYSGFLACTCGTLAIDDVFKCGVCGERWGNSASGQSDSSRCEYCDGTYSWESCPECLVGDMKHVDGSEDDYRCVSCRHTMPLDELECG